MHTGIQFVIRWITRLPSHIQSLQSFCGKRFLPLNRDQSLINKTIMSYSTEPLCCKLKKNPLRISSSLWEHHVLVRPVPVVLFCIMTELSRSDGKAALSLRKRFCNQSWESCAVTNRLYKLCHMRTAGFN